MTDHVLKAAESYWLTPLQVVILDLFSVPGLMSRGDASPWFERRGSHTRRLAEFSEKSLLGRDVLQMGVLFRKSLRVLNVFHLQKSPCLQVNPSGTAWSQEKWRRKPRKSQAASASACPPGPGTTDSPCSPCSLLSAPTQQPPDRLLHLKPGFEWGSAPRLLPRPPLSLWSE